MPKVSTEKKINARWRDPVSLAALEEAKQIEKDPNSKGFNNAADLIADCLGEDDDDD